ncbi:MAG: hypothetical protein OEW35_03415 [Gammaproteobacteria bacterium]|nr:hypothetical protein [Gammaproteobacteria bacterium]MDH4255681.1 hypothetical protein [Gammaproteobacteria bacterium]
MKWLGLKFFRGEGKPKPEARLRATGAHARPRPPKAQEAPKPPAGSPGGVSFRPELEGRIEDGGPGKNVLMRNRYIREDTGTHEKLTIIDEDSLEEDSGKGFDPYNTGQFDRSRNWSRRPK